MPETEAVVCCNCDCAIENEYSRCGEIYCEDCFDKLFFTCDECREIVSRDDMDRYEDYFYCSDCFGRLFGQCYRCGAWSPHDETRVTSQDDIICENCYINHYFTCGSCGEVIHSDNYGYNGLCDSCNEENGIIRDHSYCPDWNYYGRGNTRDVLYLGFELEFEYNGDCTSGMLEEYFETDSRDYLFKIDRSISHGAELVSHPRTLQSHKEYNWKDAFSYLSKHGCTSHNTRTCGLHVHTNRRYFSMADQIKLGIFVNMQSLNFVKLARRDSEQWSKYKYLEKGKLKYSAYSENRYEAVNFTNSSTIEFRMFKGTLRYETVIATLELVDATCKFVKTVSFPQLVSSEAWTLFSRFVHDNKKEYSNLIKYADERSKRCGGYIFCVSS